MTNQPLAVKRYRGRSADHCGSRQYQQHWPADPVDRASIQRLIDARVDRLLAEYGRLCPALVDTAAQMAVDEGPPEVDCG